MLDVFIAAISFAVLSDEHPAGRNTAAAAANGANRRRVIESLRERGGRNGPAPAGSPRARRGRRVTGSVRAGVDHGAVVPLAEPVEDAGVVAVAGVAAVADRQAERLDRPVAEDGQEHAGVARPEAEL